jgi:hypothetical protein
MEGKSMASLPITWFKKRRSALKLPVNLKVSAQLLQLTNKLLEESAPFRRKGYPRAGGYDRLTIIVFSAGEGHQLLIRYYIPGPRMLYIRDYKIQGQLIKLLPAQNNETVNSLLIVGLRKTPGANKYGERNLGFARIEQGVFLQALHSELCYKSIPNHIQGGIEIQRLPVRLPLDFEEIIGLVV